MKTCDKCLVTQDEDQFYLRSDTGKRRMTCKRCWAKKTRTHYDANKDKALARSLASKKRHREAGLALLIAHLETHPCVDCGEADLLVLDLDHVRGVKKCNVTKLIWDGQTIDKIKQEIAKCEVRCSNCHRRRTAMVLGSHRYRYLNGSVSS